MASGQYRPGTALQLPEHAAVGILEALPYVPSGHTAQLSEPLRLYRPAGHSPLQLLDEWPATAPYRPAGQGVQEVSLAAMEYVPTGHNTPTA